MSRVADRRRLKWIYLAVIVALLIPVSILSQPATINAEGRPVGVGVISVMRGKHNLDQSALGEIDPAGETMRLATFGLRAFAATMLWSKSNEQKVKEDWTGFRATLDQLCKLQPNYISVWRFQGWNLSYNVSVEFDDYKSRYYWIKEGVKYLMDGTRYNEEDYRLVSDIGWYTAYKFGRADEKVSFRRLFKQDDDEVYPNHRIRREDRRDNWLVGKEFFHKAEDMVGDLGLSLGGTSPCVFYSHSAMAQINFAENLEKDGIFDEKARVAWDNALADWDAFGSRELVSLGGLRYRLSSLDENALKWKQLSQRLELMAPGAREQIRLERIATLPTAQREAILKPRKERTREEMQRAMLAERSIMPSHVDVAQRSGDKQAAMELARNMLEMEQLMGHIEKDRGTSNYGYWKMRCEMERTDDALAAREQLYVAQKAYDDSDLPRAKEQFNLAFANWRTIMDKHPSLVKDDVSGSDLLDAIVIYNGVLQLLQEDMPKPFILQDLIDAQGAKDRDVRVTEDLPPGFTARMTQSQATDGASSPESPPDVDTTPSVPNEDSPAKDDASSKDSTATDQIPSARQPDTN